MRDEIINCEAYPMSDIYLMDKFAIHIAGKWHYVHDHKRWYFFDGEKWQLDNDNEIKVLVVQFLRSSIYWPEAAYLSSNQKLEIQRYRYAGMILKEVTSNQEVATVSHKLGLPSKVEKIRCGWSSL